MEKVMDGIKLAKYLNETIGAEDKPCFVKQKINMIHARISEAESIIGDLWDKLDIFLVPERLTPLNKPGLDDSEVILKSELCDQLDKITDRVIGLQNKLINILERVDN